MTKVEEIARAIYDADNDLDGDCVGDMIYGDFRIDGPAVNAKEQTMRVCRAAALAALKAMREPSEVACRAGIETSPMFSMPEVANKSGLVSLSTGMCADIYRAMIDAAVAEHEGRE